MILDFQPDLVVIMMYKYSEDKVLSELKKYIDSTYDEHYSQNKYQATEFILDIGHGAGFCIGNILKYAQRYGKKGTDTVTTTETTNYVTDYDYAAEATRLWDIKQAINS